MKTREERAAYWRAWRAKNRDHIRVRNRAYYAETQAERLAYQQQWRAANREKVRKSNNATRIKTRLLVLAHYAGGTPTCACCGERELKFLGLDHINGGGREHRRRSGSSLLLQLKNEGFPPGFQVLCHNCNLAKGFYGSCPHQQMKLEAM